MTDLKNTRILFTDIDGTLLPTTGKDLGPTADLLADLIRRGYEVVPCTGRGTGNIPAVIRDVPGVRYLITANGALVVERDSGRYLYEARMPMDTARAILHFLRRYPGNTFCYLDGIHYIDNCRPVDAVQEGYDSTVEWLRRVTFVDMEAFCSEHEGALDKMGFFSFDEALKTQILKDFEEQPFRPQLLLSKSGAWNIEINMALANKGAAAAYVLKMLGYAPEQMIAAGDNLNDLSMLQLAGVSVAPANALAPVRAAADVVTEDCSRDGVEHFLETLPDLFAQAKPRRRWPQRRRRRRIERASK